MFDFVEAPPATTVYDKFNPEYATYKCVLERLTDDQLAEIEDAIICFDQTNYMSMSLQDIIR